MTKPELIVGHVYATKRPREVGVFVCRLNDRMIVYLSATVVQYDSPALRDGQKYPKIARDKFEKWVHEDVTDQMPFGDWRKADHRPDTKSP